MSQTSKRRFLLAPFLLAPFLVGAPAIADTPPTFRIVESVPEASIYGEPGVPRTQDVWLEMIRHARHSIDIAAFYVADKPGHALAPVLDALVERARAGVPVRLLVEKSFMKDTGPSTARLQGVPNLTIEILPTGQLTGGVLHAKYMIVDAVQVFVGSQNWDWRALEEIHEIGAEITDARFARSFEAAFEELWALGADPDLPKAQKRSVLPPDFAPVTSADPVILDRAGNDPLVAFPAFSPPPMIPAWLTQEEPALIEMIHAARHTVRIQVMTLSAIHSYGPKGFWPGLDTAFRDAAARGVSVEIIVADWALHEPMQSYLKSLAVFPGITVKFSSVPQAPSGFIPYARVEHCKYAVADDDSVYVGTGNWEWSYFATTVDASVFVHGKGPAATLTRIFERDWTSPNVTQISAGTTYTPPRTQ
ncbi:MAG: phospholipase D-like domain-containing protein [Janthinobacterium lividum]